jgi:hypothetical protein
MVRSRHHSGAQLFQMPFAHFIWVGSVVGIVLEAARLRSAIGPAFLFGLPPIPIGRRRRRGAALARGRSPGIVFACHGLSPLRGAYTLWARAEGRDLRRPRIAVGHFLQAVLTCISRRSALTLQIMKNPSPDGNERIPDFLARHGGAGGKTNREGESEGGMSGWTGH